MTVPKFHDKANAIRHETLTLYYTDDGLVKKSGGKFVRPKRTSYTVRGQFAPVSFRMIPTPSGGLSQAQAEAQIDKRRLDALGIDNPQSYITSIQRNGRMYTVVARDDYSHHNGMYIFYLTAEVDSDSF